MERSTSSSIRNREQRPVFLVNSAEFELSNIPPPQSRAFDSVSKVAIPNGHAQFREQLTSHSQTGDSTENDRNDNFSLHDTGSDVTVVTRSLRTWDVAALIINKMVRFCLINTPPGNV